MSDGRIRQSITATRRKAINLSQGELVECSPLIEAGRPPLLVQPAIDGVDLVSWAAANRVFIENHLLNSGAILFRGFDLKTPEEFEHFVVAVAGELLEYTYGSTPRRQVSGHIYTSTEYPPEEVIPLHNEMSYSRAWPMKICFFCVQPAQQGGETPIADSRKVLMRIAPGIRDRLARKGVTYVRNYGGNLDLSWQAVFQTSNRSEVEDYCRRAGIAFEWRADNSLRTRQVCQAVAAHPKSGEMVWFNQAHLFHISNLLPEVRRELLATLAEEDLPRNVYYGDGSPIEDQVLDEIRENYKREAVVFSWQKGDVLLLDNMLTAHGRRPYSGQRKVLVGMAEQFISTETF